MLLSLFDNPGRYLGWLRKGIYKVGARPQLIIGDDEQIAVPKEARRLMSDVTPVLLTCGRKPLLPCQSVVAGPMTCASCRIPGKRIAGDRAGIQVYAAAAANADGGYAGLCAPHSPHGNAATWVDQAENG